MNTLAVLTILLLLLALVLLHAIVTTTPSFAVTLPVIPSPRPRLTLRERPNYLKQPRPP